MRVIVAGLGVQGYKRQKIAGDDCIATVDPVNPEADFKRIEDVPVDSYDAVLACIPDEPKNDLIRTCLSGGKHVLVEKPLWVSDEAQITELQSLARSNNAVCYTAYNHRFEPHFMAMRDLIASGELGRIYRCRLFYGNGTARLVRNSAWRDQGAGVLPDLGSHLLDTLRFWFGPITDDFELTSSDCFENQAPDHVVFTSRGASPRIECEMALLSWRNHFTCDIFAEGGTAHISSLCKWGPTQFTHRRRILPSGRPPEDSRTLIQDDPTWALEYDHFKRLCAEKQVTDLSDDLWLHRTLSRLSQEAIGS